MEATGDEEKQKRIAKARAAKSVLWFPEPCTAGEGSFLAGRTPNQKDLMGCQALAGASGTEPDQWSFLQPPDRERRLNAFPDVEHHGVAGAGHYIHVEQPDETLRLLDAFLHRP